MREWHYDSDERIESCGGYTVLSYLHVPRANFPICPGVKKGS